MLNIIVQIKEAEKNAKELLEKIQKEGLERSNKLREEKEEVLKNIEANMQPKIKDLIDSAEKDINGMGMMHKTELDRKLKELEHISKEKLDKAVDYILSKLTTLA